MDNIVKILEDGKKLIEDKKNWIQGSSALDANGNEVAACSRYAVYFCSVGAIERVTFASDPYYHSYWPALDLLRDAVGMGVTTFNDNSTHEDVMAMWDKAITLAKGE